MAGNFDEISINGKVSVFVDDNSMWAKVLVTKAQNGGKEITKEDVLEELDKNGVKAGINERRIDEYLANLPENKSVTVAEAIPVIDGGDGKVIYNYEPKNEFKPSIDEETGIVNFKELGRIRNIKKGTILATIVQNTDGVAGVNVRGEPIAPAPGKPPVYSIGPGTILSHDQSKIFAAEDGNLRWDKDRFVVDTVVTIAGHVDASVGNIDFAGDVVVKGSISEGYTVKGKNVTVKENVTNSTVKATETIDIKGGAVHSELISDGNIIMSFAESSHISCKGHLQSKSLVNCNVFSEGGITVQGGKGIIVGGECTSYENIIAAQVGSDNYAKTTINLGNTPILIKSHHELKDYFEMLSKNYKELKVIYEKLNYMRKIRELTERQENARKQAFLFILNERNTLAEMQIKMEDNEKIIEKSRLLQLVVQKKCFPNVTIKLFSSIYDNTTENPSTVFYLDADNEIRPKSGV